MAEVTDDDDDDDDDDSMTEEEQEPRVQRTEKSVMTVTHLKRKRYGWLDEKEFGEDELMIVFYSITVVNMYYMYQCTMCGVPLSMCLCAFECLEYC